MILGAAIFYLYSPETPKPLGPVRTKHFYGIKFLKHITFHEDAMFNLRIRFMIISYLLLFRRGAGVIQNIVLLLDGFMGGVFRMTPYTFSFKRD